MKRLISYPDVILVDISMPVLSGLDAVRLLKDKGVTSKVIFLTMHADQRLPPKLSNAEPMPTS